MFQRLARPHPLTHWEGLTLTPLLLLLGNSSVGLSVTLYGQQDWESHLAVMQ